MKNIRIQIKDLLFYFLTNLAGILPISWFSDLMGLVKENRIGFFLYFIKKSDNKVIEKLHPKLISSTKFLNESEESKHKIHVLDRERYEPMQLPNIYGVSLGGKINLFKKEISLFKFNNAEFHPYSDFIRLEKSAYWDKLTRPQLVKTIAQDRDLIKYSTERRAAVLRNYPYSIEIKAGFSLCGVHVNSWGHFIGNFLPKLVALQMVNDEPELKIIIPDNVDDHIKELVSRIVASIGNYEIIYLQPDSLVKCQRLYYCNATSFIADHANYLTTPDIQITKFSTAAIYKYSQELQKQKKSDRKASKIYIARRGGRNLENHEEIEAYFQTHGFEIVFPHLMSFDEKIELFMSASHVCGPYSSGFANIIFCKPGTKVLAFCNYARTEDSYISIIGKSTFDLDVNMLTGIEEPTANPHNSFLIPVERVKQCVEHFDFLA